MRTSPAYLVWVLLLALVAVVRGEPPPVGYYALAEGKLGTELRGSLADIIGGHTRVPYSWEPFFVLDEDPNNPNNVILIYSGFSRPKLPTNTHWNREHIWPRSRGLGNSGIAHDDLHNLTPINPGVNSARGNNYFEYTDPTSSGYRAPGFYTEAPLASRDSFAWEPPDADKGFVARAVFYMATRYRGHGTEPTLQLSDLPPTSTPWGNEMGVFKTLVEWNRMHPPSDFERRRNQKVYQQFQHNRNPFIDYPELVDAVFTSHLYLAPGTWRVQNFSFAELDDPNTSGWAADPDGDGIPNLHEYAFGLHPRQPASEAPVRLIALGDGTALISFSILRNAESFGLVYEIERSLDLEVWHPIAADASATISTGSGWYDQLEKPITLTDGERQKFIRVRVSIPR